MILTPQFRDRQPSASHGESEGDDATVHSLTGGSGAAPWLFDWTDARERMRTAAADAGRALRQSDQLTNELLAVTHDGLMREASRAFAREFGIDVDMLPESRLSHIHTRPPAPPFGDAR